MPSPRSLGLWFVMIWSGEAAGRDKPLSPEELEARAIYVVVGRVETVYTAERVLDKDSTDTLYAIEVTIHRVEKAGGKASGKTIVVKTWRPAKRPAGRPAASTGQDVIPAVGDIATFHLTGGDSTFEALTPNGIRVTAPAKHKSQATGLESLLVYGGEFEMGSDPEESGRRIDEHQHRVRITRPFLLGVHEVTQDEYTRVTGVNPSWFAPTGGGRDRVIGEDTKRFPVERVSWFDAASFCNQLSEKDGFDPYYKLDGVRREGDSIAAATVTVLGGNGYRLPTEAEWEYACRAGKPDLPFHYGKENTGREANMKAVIVGGGYGGSPKWKEFGRTVKVGTFGANPWGFHDLHGNAAEWCADWYDRDYYVGSPRENPAGPARGQHRAIRGGSWIVTEWSCRAAARHFAIPAEVKEHTGFRVARTP